jgi:hypothetical protein
VATVGIALLSGAVLIGLATTVAAVCGLSTRPWPWIGTLLVLFALAGVVPPGVGRHLHVERGTDEATPATGGQLGDAAVAALVAVIGGVSLWGIGNVPVRAIDEWAIWAVRGHTLWLSGRLDPHVFNGVSAHYQHLDYPLLVPALIAWGDGISGHPTDGAAHVLLIGLLLATLLVLGWAVNLLAGLPAALAAVLLVGGTPGLISRWGTLLTADTTLVALSLALASMFLIWLHGRDGRLLPVIAVIGAGVVATKVEGTLFMLAMFVAGAGCVFRSSQQRRGLTFAFGAVVLSALPWLAWTKVHHLNSDQVNSATLKPAHLRSVVQFSRLAAGQLIHFWPGAGWALGGAAALSALLAYRLPRARPIVTFLCLAWAIATIGLWAQYLISANQAELAGPVARTNLRAHFASSAPRVLMTPAVILAIGAPLFAGLVLRDRSRDRDRSAPAPAPR